MGPGLAGKERSAWKIPWAAWRRSTSRVALDAGAGTAAGVLGGMHRESRVTNKNARIARCGRSLQRPTLELAGTVLPRGLFCDVMVNDAGWWDRRRTGR